jgi:hypothetical protein
MTVLVMLLTVVVGLLGLLVVGLLRSHAEILRSLHELGVDLDPNAGGVRSPVAAPVVRRTSSELGAPRAATDLAGVAPDGGVVSIAVEGTDRFSLLAFLTGTCSSCHAFWDAFGDDRALTVPAEARLVIVTKDPSAESLSAVRRLAPYRVPVLMSSAAWDAYDVPVAPFFVLVDGWSSLVVGEGAANTWDQVSSMVAQALADDALDDRTASTAGRRRSAAEREEHVDAALFAAGIVPGDSRLFPQSADAIDPWSHAEWLS